ncbi:hypothetical protein [Proteiniphilum sp. X52]|uniref:hypothetical protein n=1 Tax=Proteiniphilum sp. X52 TaxID=2382159 RepID=UPI0016282FB0|nr:hypothetical protein [Proteiniphilum sp. X52]
MTRACFIFLVLTSLISCVNEDFLIDEEVPDKDKGHYALLFSSAQKVSLDPVLCDELFQLIDSERGQFQNKFSFISNYFKLTPSPQWDRYKIVQLNDTDFNIFIHCEDISSEKIFNNEIMLIISKRGSLSYSYVKVLPKSKDNTGRLIAVNLQDSVYLEKEDRMVTGEIFNQGLGYLSKSVGSTRSDWDCWTEEVAVTTGIEVTRNGDRMDIKTITENFYVLHCTYAGGGVNVPPPPDFSGVIPPYNNSSSGSNNGNGSSGSNNGNSYRGNGYYGGGGNYGGNGSNHSEGGGGGSSNNNNFIDDQDNPCPDYGGMDFTPAPVEVIIEDPYANARKRFDKEIHKLVDEVKKYIQIPDGTGIKLVDHCVSNARVKDGNIEVCYQFYMNEHLTDKDRVSILYHEIYHIKNHDTYKEFEPYKMKTAITLQNVPSEFKLYIIDYVIGKEHFPSNKWESMYLEVITFQYIFPPEYYENEIQAYENEIETIKNVSDYYETERRYYLWRYKQLYEISKNYHGK